jgi:N-acyl-D-amino-acid deacylase
VTTLTLRGALVYDGSIRPPKRAGVAVEGDTIVEVGERLRTSGRIVDLDGLALAPGFIDLHSHSDVALHHDGRAEAKVRQGVTLELLGQDGLGCAPLVDGQEDQIKSLLAGWVYPDAIKKAWTWSSVSEYLRTLETQGVSPNVATLVPYGNVRHRFLGLDDRSPTTAETESIRQVIAESLADGAFGLSAGMIYLPCVFARQEELTQACRPVGETRTFFDVHVRSYGETLVDSVREMAEVCAASGARLHLCHFNAFGQANWPKLDETFAVLDRSGVEVSGDQHAYEAASTSLGAAALPPRITKGGGSKMLELLGDPATRAAVRDEMAGRRKPDWDNWVSLAGWEGVVVSYANATANKSAIGHSLAEVAASRGLEPAEATLRIVEDDARVTGTPFSVTVVVFISNDEVSSRIMRDPRWGFGTDALYVQGTPHPRCYGTFPRVLAKFVRDLRVLSLEQAIHKMTQRAAEILGIRDRGRIAVGAKADLVAFEPETVRDTATYDQPHSFPIGIPYVFVNGTAVIENGKHNGACPGRAILRRDYK